VAWRVGLESGGMARQFRAMRTTAQAVLNDFKSLPSAEQMAISREIARWLATHTVAAADDDPIRSARGMFAGSRLGEALHASRAEERRRG